MKFRLSLWPPVLEIETQPIEQVSTTDLVTALWSAISQHPMQPIVLVEDGADDGAGDE